MIIETAYLVRRDLGSAAVADFLDLLVDGQFELLEPTEADLKRAAEVIRQYADSQIDFVDAAFVAIAERLNILRILTINALHFRLFRPKHCDAFDLLP